MHYVATSVAPSGPALSSISRGDFVCLSYLLLQFCSLLSFDRRHQLSLRPFSLPLLGCYVLPQSASNAARCTVPTLGWETLGASIETTSGEIAERTPSAGVTSCVLLLSVMIKRFEW